MGKRSLESRSYLEELCRSKLWSASELARQSGVGLSAVRELILGNCILYHVRTPGRLAALSAVFGLTPQELAEGDLKFRRAAAECREQRLDSGAAVG